jgi:hypothetical protein
MAAFTAIATGAGLAISAATTGASFAQAGKQRKLQRAAEQKAQEMMADARRKLEVNFYDQLAVQKEPYELEREAMIAAGAQAIEAGRESERGAAATAGRVQLAQQQGQRDIATAMGQEMLGLEKLSAQEDSRLRDIGLQLDLEEVAGAQVAAANAQEMAAAATTQGMQGIQSFASQLAAAAPLYEKSASAREFKKLQKEAAKGNMTPQQLQARLAKIGAPGGIDLSGVGTMNPNQFSDFMMQRSAADIRNINRDLMRSLSLEQTLKQGLPYGFNPIF